MLRDRDKAIISDLERFRAMKREHISTLYFQHVKNPTKEANNVLLRLKREGHISVSTDRRMYTYYPAKSIKKNSSKLDHYLSIVDFYCLINQHNKPRRFDVEPKLDVKGTIEPDVFLIWNNTAFFVEIQKSDYSKKQWQDKMNRYEQYYQSGLWKNLDWQPQDKKLFPIIWIVGRGQGLIQGQSFRCIHATVEEMVERMKK